jgi:hypothetical protein
MRSTKNARNGRVKISVEIDIKLLSELYGDKSQEDFMDLLNLVIERGLKRTHDIDEMSKNYSKILENIRICTDELYLDYKLGREVDGLVVTFLQDRLINTAHLSTERKKAIRDSVDILQKRIDGWIAP